MKGNGKDLACLSVAVLSQKTFICNLASFLVRLLGYSGA